MGEGIKNKEHLLSLTLRQLRQEASKLSVPLYSRKTKAVLIDLIIKYQNKQLLFKENIYLFNSYRESEIFAQHRTIFLNSFLEFNEETYMLTEVNSWVHKITKNEFICRVVN